MTAQAWRVGADRRIARVLTHPVRLVPLAFLAVIGVGTLALMLPVAHTSGEPDLMAAAFTTVSAVCVTGLATVDTATYWTPFGQVVIMLLIQVGGFGIMTLATLLSLLVRGRVGVSGQLRARAETHAFDAGGSVTGLIRRIAVRMLAAEAIVALALTLRFRAAYDDTWGASLWHGVFHAVSAFNNAGFALFSGNLVPFVGDAFICVPICVAIVAGGIGYPVYFELVSRWRRPNQWSVHTRITVGGTVILLVTGTLAYLVFEWSNPATMGPMSVWDKVLASGTASVVARTAGFNSIDYGAITGATLVITLVLMFVGGGSAGTAGGIKITTFFLLGFLILAEARGEEDVVVAPADRCRGAASGGVGGAPRGRRRHPGDHRRGGADRLPARRGGVRGGVGVRHRGAVDRPDAHAGTRAAAGDHGVDVRRPRRHDHARLRPRAAQPQAPLPLPRGASHCRLSSEAPAAPTASW